MLCVGDGRFLFGSQEFDAHPTLVRRMCCPGGFPMDRAVWDRIPHAPTHHWDLADALMHRRAPHFRRGVGDKRYTKWHTEHSRMRSQPTHAPWPNLEGPARRAHLRPPTTAMRRWGVALKILAIRSKR